MSLIKREIQQRISNLQEKMQAGGIELAVIISDINLYYLAGTIQAEYLFIPQSGQAFLLSRRGISHARTEALVEVIEFKSSAEIPDVLKEQKLTDINNLGLELDVVSYQKVNKISNILATKQIDNVNNLIAQLRMIKSEFEIKQSRKSAKQLLGIVDTVRDNFNLGMSEIELSALIEYHLRSKGHSGIVRMKGLNNNISLGICSAGKNTLTPVKTDALCGGSGTYPGFIGASEKEIRKNEAITVDFVSNYHGYHIDQTRLFVVEKANKLLLDLYDKMSLLEKKLSSYLTVDYSWSHIYKKSLELAEELDVKDYYLGSGNNQVRFVGHGVGLELNEYPFLAPGFKQQLEVGMLVALEPKLLHPELGLVGIENTYLITEFGPEKLTKSNEDLIII